MVYLRNYAIHKNRLKSACIEGMTLEHETLHFQDQEETHRFFLGAIDGVNEDTKWGRLSFLLEKQKEQICKLHLFVSNYKDFLRKDVLTKTNDFLLDKEIPAEHKEALFTANEEVEFVNKSDVLLYELEGRYLWIYIEVQGIGEGNISNLRITLPGDNFMKTFPEVYQDYGSFFHRYLSVFSSIYNDFQTDIDHIADKLDIDTAPAEMLPIFAGWLGVDVSGNFLGEVKLRSFVKEIYQLNRYKGTKQVLERLAQIVLEEKVLVVEKNMVEERTATKKQVNTITLYGKTPYDVTILVRNYVEEQKKSQLFFLLQQFVPIRCRLNIVYLQDNGVLDSYCYLDMNAKVYQKEQAILDHNNSLENYRVLQ